MRTKIILSWHFKNSITFLFWSYLTKCHICSILDHTLSLIMKIFKPKTKKRNIQDVFCLIQRKSAGFTLSLLQPREKFARNTIHSWISTTLEANIHRITSDKEWNTLNKRKFTLSFMHFLNLSLCFAWSSNCSLYKTHKNPTVQN